MPRTPPCCKCVPVLKSQLAQLKAENEELKSALNDYDKSEAILVQKKEFRDRMKMLEAQLAQLQGEHLALQEKYHLLEPVSDKAFFRLEAQTTRYRDIVESVAGQDCHKHDKWFGQKPCGTCISCQARSALESKEGAE